MHKGGAPRAHSYQTSQEQADRCCAASEQRRSSSSGSAFTLTIPSTVLTVAAILPAEPSTHVLRDAWHDAAPVDVSHTPKHVLLSVFLV